MPWPTIFLMNASGWMVTYWWTLLIGGTVVGVGFALFIKTDIGRFWWDKSKLTMPVFKRMFRALYVSRSLHTMGELLNAGVPMLDTLAITGDISGKRGRIVGTESKSNGEVEIAGSAPLAELDGYQSKLKSITGGQGSYTMNFSHYEPVPPKLQSELIAAYKPGEEDD